MPTKSSFMEDGIYADETSKLAQVREIASDKLGLVRQVATQKLGEARTFAGEKLAVAKTRATALFATCEKFARERPGTAVLLSLGAGWLVGKIVKR